MLGNGKGKTRMNSDAELRETSQWRLCYLSSGETTVSEMMQETGQKSKLGQEIRLINIDIDDSPFGIFSKVNFAKDAASQAQFLNTNTKLFHGVVGLKWLDYLTQDKNKAKTLATKLNNEFKESLKTNSQHGHLQRVADFFALIATAGEMATQAGITNWKNGTALHAIQVVYNDWLAKFQFVGNYEEKQILTQVKSFFEANSNSRFELINPPLNSMGYEPVQKIINRVGYIKNDRDGHRKFLVYPQQFRTEIAKGFNHKKVQKLIKKYGWLDCDTGIYQKNERLPESKDPQKMYVFNEKMWEWSDDE